MESIFNWQVLIAILLNVYFPFFKNWFHQTSSLALFTKVPFVVSISSSLTFLKCFTHVWPFIILLVLSTAFFHWVPFPIFVMPFHPSLMCWIVINTDYPLSRYSKVRLSRHNLSQASILRQPCCLTVNFKPRGSLYEAGPVVCAMHWIATTSCCSCDRSYHEMDVMWLLGRDSIHTELYWLELVQCLLHTFYQLTFQTIFLLGFL